jgi:ligand-binding SRPBCC domain-containing protein
MRDGVEGTLVSDDVEFELPYGVLGRAAGVIVRRSLEKSFAYRQRRLPEILAAAARQAVRRG